MWLPVSSELNFISPKHSSGQAAVLNYYLWSNSGSSGAEIIFPSYCSKSTENYLGLQLVCLQSTTRQEHRAKPIAHLFPSLRICEHGLCWLFGGGLGAGILASLGREGMVRLGDERAEFCFGVFRGAQVVKYQRVAFIYFSFPFYLSSVGSLCFIKWWYLSLNEIKAVLKLGKELVNDRFYLLT